MAFQISPGVNVSEIDLTTVVPSVLTTAGAFAGTFRWGPANKVVLVDSEITLTKTFGEPDSNSAVSFFTSAGFLAYGNNLSVVRAVGTSAKNATSNTSNQIFIANRDIFEANGYLTNGNSNTSGSVPTDSTQYALNDIGVTATGIDIDKRVIGKPLLSQESLLDLNGKYKRDLVICFEVAEHLDPQYSDEIVRNVYESIEDGGVLLWTAALPGQGGVGHINCRPKAFWKEKFEKMGLIHDDSMQEDIISYCKEGRYMGWFVNNILCFRKA